MKLNRPKLSNEESAKLAAHFFAAGEPAMCVYAVRGYFLNSIGKPGANDFNTYDDAVIVRHDGQLAATFNANTDPSKPGAGKAMLQPGIYQFYRGLHKGRIKAFRAYPEGVRLPVERLANGLWQQSTAQYINIHDGGLSDTWSEGCQTLPGARAAQVWGDQFKEFRDLIYNSMDELNLVSGTVNGRSEKLLTYVLLDHAGLKRILEAQ